MPTNPKWQRYFEASVNTHFDSGLKTAIANFQTYVQGQDTDMTLPEYAEIRMQGPSFMENGKGHFNVDLTVNIAVIVLKQDDIYRLRDLSGLIESLFTTIEIMTYESDDTLPITSLCCLSLDGKIRTTNWGDITIGKDQVRVKAATVEALFKGNL